MAAEVQVLGPAFFPTRIDEARLQCISIQLRRGTGFLVISRNLSSESKLCFRG